MENRVNELLDLVKADDDSAFAELKEIFQPLITAETVKILSVNPSFRADEDEFRQEALLALYKAARSYRSEEQRAGQKESDGKVTFGLYAKICIRNRVISYARKLNTEKKRAEKALEAEKKSAVGSFTDEFSAAVESNSEIRRIFEENTTPLEKQIFLMYLDKRSYKEIAQAVGKSEKSVDNAIYRVKSKIKKLLM
jgi:RNA polymerase sporulation-specific sigma factor